MDRKFCNRENTKYICILCGNCVYNVLQCLCTNSKKDMVNKTIRLGNVLMVHANN